MNAVIDHLDVYYLANTFNIAHLRHEISQANIKAYVSEQFADTPYEGKNPFPWSDYAGACREAVSTIQEHNKKKPKPEVSGKRIDIEALKSRLDIVNEVERYTKLRKSGRNFTGLCPLHQDTSPSLTVYPDKQTWHCFGACNRGGDVIDFTMAAEGVDFKQAAAILGGA